MRTKSGCSGRSESNFGEIFSDMGSQLLTKFYETGRQRGTKIMPYLEKEVKMPLIMAPTGRELKILKVAVDEKTKRHLENLGILAGASVTAVSQNNGNVIIIVKNGRLALNKEVAMKILVA